MFECCYRSMLFISKMEFLCCLEKVIAFSANFSNLLCAALRIFEDLQWMIWHFCLLIVLSKILVQTSNDVYEIVAQSTLRSSWISNYPHPMLEEKEKKKRHFWDVLIFLCTMCWRHIQNKMILLLSRQIQLLHYGLADVRCEKHMLTVILRPFGKEIWRVNWSSWNSVL